jgi:hypothetical protein
MFRSRIVLPATALLGAAVCAIALGSDLSRDQLTPRKPVLVELFTSEGCSSCPPADRVLARLLEEQPVPGVEVIALGFHVDYWDRLGWRDPFSSSRYTDRQQAYARVLGVSSIYTPQAVIDGTREFIGSDWNAARRLLTDAKSAIKTRVTLTAQADATDNRRVTIRIDVGRPEGSTVHGDVLLALVEDGLSTDVRRGENANRRLSHAAVVRSLERTGTISAQTGFSATRTVVLDPSWNRTAVKAVAFVQDSTSLRVAGVAACRF